MHMRLWLSTTFLSKWFLTVYHTSSFLLYNPWRRKKRSCKKNLDFCLSWLFSQGGSVSWMPLGTKVPSQTSNVTHIYNSLIKLLVKMVRFLVPLQKLPNFSYYMVCLYKSQIRQKMAYWYHILAGTVHSTLSSIEFKSLHAALWVMK